MIESKSKFALYKHGLPYYAEVELIIELISNNKLEIIENYNGNQSFSQGYIEEIPKNGYEHWKKGITKGIKYANLKIINNTGLKITLTKGSGLTTDTNPTIIGYTASRAILNKLENNESESELELIKNLVFKSWEYELDSLPNFNKICIDGNKIKQPSSNKTTIFNRINNLFK